MSASIKSISNRILPYYLIIVYLLSIFSNSILIEGLKTRELRDDFYYFPVDIFSDNQQLNDIRCKDYEGHVSAKSKWPYSCLLPASHLATGRILDGTSSKPDRELAPPWLNITLFKHGQQFARENTGQLLLSHIYGLFCSNLFLDSKEVLLFTGQFDQPREAATMYMRIIKGIFKWYRSHAPATDFPSFSKVAKSVRNARLAHRNVTLAAEKWIFNQRTLIGPSIYKSRSVNEDLWTALRKDVGSSGIPYENRKFPIEYILTEDKRRPINQFIQAMTQFGMVGIPILFPEGVGLTNVTDSDLFAFNHLWAVIGYCLGIRDEYNISLQPDLHTTRKYFQDIFETFIQPAFFHIDFFTKILIDPMLEGINRLEAMMTPGVIVTKLLRDVMKISVNNSYKRLGALEKISMTFTDTVLKKNLKVNQLLIKLVGDIILNGSS